MRCSVCNADKDESQYTKSQLKKGAGVAKCTDCAKTAEGGDATSPTQTQQKQAKKICSQCHQPNKVFSKHQLHKEDGKCVTCTEKSNPSSFWKQSEEATSEQQSEVETRQLCISCNVFKPEKSFEKSSSTFCHVCWEAKKNHRQSTTMKDHGFVRGDGTSHKHLDIVPETLAEYLAYYEELKHHQQQQHNDRGEEEYEEEEEGEEEDYYYA